MSEVVGHRRRTIDAVLVAVAGALFVGAGVLSILAAQIRWGQACAGGFDTEPCVIVQDHLYDYLLPTQPWVPIGDAAIKAGAAHVLVSAALALMFSTMRSPLWCRLLQVVTVGSVLTVGLATLAAGRTGQPVELGGLWWVILPWMLPVPFIAVVLQWVSDDRFDRLMPAPAWMSWMVAVILATPLAEFFLGSAVVGYMSHDTTPWDGAVSGGLLILAGVVVLGGILWARVPGRSPAQR